MLKNVAEAKIGCLYVRQQHSPGGLMLGLFEKHIMAPLWVIHPDDPPNLVKNFIYLKQDMKVGIPETTPKDERNFLNDIWTYVCGPYYDLPCKKEVFENGSKQ